ncbi:MAG: hypothetical protein AB7G75_16905 [Candidatus Binatia bacterium]
MSMFGTKQHKYTRTRTTRLFSPFLIFLVILCLASNLAWAKNDDDDDDDDDDRSGRRGVCSQTAKFLSDACNKEVQNDYFKARAICLNVLDTEEHSQCNVEATTTRNENQQLCRAQRTARLDVCKAIGEDRYEPNFAPDLFETDFANLPQLNPYLPLAIGNQWGYAGGEETIKIEVLNETKLIEGVTCIVVRDQVSIDGDLHEDTDDWFCQAKNGDVYYGGEEVKDFESFDGDNSRRPELVSIDGSFKHGRDGDKGGILFFMSPIPGQVCRQEFSVATAEDVAEVLSITYSFGANPDLDRFVPQNLAELLCSSGNCVVTKEYSPIEPETVERQYYTPGIGVFLEVNLDTGETVQLVNCNFDSRCPALSNS